jgi:hypothetical protein
MPSFYDIDFNKFAIKLLPPDKRYTRLVAFVRVLLSPLQYNRNITFGTYRTGNPAPVWVAGTYNKYDQVQYRKAVYESLKAGNTATPDDAAAWRLIQADFLGMDERIKYNGQRLVIEYALNKYLGTTFRQPPLTSDTTISLIPPVLAGFLIGQTVAESVGQTTSSATIGLPSPFYQAYNFNILTPSAVLAANSVEGIRAFVRRYIPASINFQITPY